ncbi:unnamed protein product [Caenorhabditis sp. 36 PRJEB53466]|nr:unnamed protein product [Caenorhabditis sp. 36 PRJEB53466]
MNYSTLILLFALCSIAVAVSPLWFEEEEPTLNLRAYRMNQLDSMDGARRLLKRANMFNKRRGRELFGKRSMPLDYADDSAASVIYENRFRRRANELFG